MQIRECQKQEEGGSKNKGHIWGEQQQTHITVKTINMNHVH